MLRRFKIGAPTEVVQPLFNGKSHRCVETRIAQFLASCRIQNGFSRTLRQRADQSLPRPKARCDESAMISPTSDRLFAGSIPELYENYLVPLIFEPYAADLASRVVLCRPSRVLEIAAGTGVVARHLARALPKEASIVATDLNQPMLDQAAAIRAARPIEWRQ